MKLQGSIVRFSTKVTASGDTVNTVSLEVFGPVEALHDLMKKPLSIELTESEKGPFES
jgi:hypothetical protein